MTTNLEPVFDKPEIINLENPSEDPFIREFLAFCKINGLEKRAAELLDKAIAQRKREVL